MNCPRAHLYPLVLVLSLVVVPMSARAGTDQNGFFDSYLVAIGYDATGAVPSAADAGSDYLCDGNVSEDSILPSEGFPLEIPILDPASCGTKPLATTSFDENALVDVDGLTLPIRFETVNNSTLDFRGIVRNALGNNTLTPSNVMAYAWVYITNNTEEAIERTMGIGSDDSMVVEVNRVEVFRHLQGRGSGGNNTVQNRFPVVLQPGGNLVQFKVWQGGGGWSMRARLETGSACPDTSRQPRDPVLSDPLGPIFVDTFPVDVFEPINVSRGIVASGDSPAEVRATITVTADNAGQPWNLREDFDAGWEIVSTSPAAAETGAGFARWQGVTAGRMEYVLRRIDEWNAEDGDVSGRATIAGALQVVGGDSRIDGGLTPFVRSALLTAALNIADGVDELGNPVDINGCNVTPAQITGDWIVGVDGASEAVTDATIIPFEGMELLIDYGGGIGGLSQSDGLSFLGLDAEARYWANPGDSLGAMVINRADSIDGLFDFQRGDIYGPVDQTMNVAYFYALNTSAEPRNVVIAFVSDDSGGVRVNGHVAHAITACRGTGNFDIADRFEVRLDPGKNLIGCYTFESGGGFGMRVRFESLEFEPLRIPTTLDPAGYDPAEHPDPGELRTFPPLVVTEVLATAALAIGNGFHGSNIPVDRIAGPWIVGDNGGGEPVDDASIVPFEGMELFLDFAGASQASELLEVQQTAKDRFWIDPFNSTGGFTVQRVASATGFYNWQDGGIFGAAPDPNVVMNVAWFYAINEEDKPRCVVLSFGSDDSGGVRVNGRSVHAITIGRGTPQFDASDKVRVRLDPGKNLVSCYTFDNAGGWGLRVRFEDLDGNPLPIPTTLDPTGYDPSPAAHPDPGEVCPIFAGDGYQRGGPANGIVTQYLVPQRPLDQSMGGSTRSLAAPENYISIDGEQPEADNVREGALVGPGIEGIDDPGNLPITTGIRDSVCGSTTLVVFDGFVNGDGAADPGDFNSQVFYPGDPLNFSSTLFFFVDNVSGGPLDAWFAFASDDGGTLYVNSEFVVEWLTGRGRGGNNVLQTFADTPATLQPGVNLVQFSYNQGVGGSGARVGFFADECFDRAFSPTEVRVSANPPGFVPGQDAPVATRDVGPFDCDGVAEVTLTISTPDDADAEIDLIEQLPDGTTGSDPSHGAFNAEGTVLTVRESVADGTVISYTLRDAGLGLAFCGSTIDGELVVGEDSILDDGCPTRCRELDIVTGGAPEFLIIGPVDLGRNAGLVCDDNGSLPTTDYLAGDGINEANVAPLLGDELMPDFGGEAGGVGVKPAPNPTINPRADEGILTVWVASADNAGYVDFNSSRAIGDTDDYIVYAFTYLENTTDEPIEALLEVGSDDSVKVVFNGEQIHTNQICRGIPAPGAGDILPVTLEPGFNSVLIGVVERGGGTGVRLLVLDQFSLPFIDGSVRACRAGEIEPPPVGVPYVRGDTNADGNINLSDGVNVLNVLFLGFGTIPCDAAGDTNGDGSINLSDGVNVLNVLFLGFGNIPPPAACGDLLADEADCAAFAACP